MTYSDMNWCLSCWKDFTTLNDEERKVYDMLKIGLSVEEMQERMRNNLGIKRGGRKKQICQILVKETGQVFNSAKEIASFFNVTTQNVYSALRLNVKLKRQYTLKKIA